MNKHTPGPWKVESDGSITKGAMDHTLRGPNGKYLASLCETSDDPLLQARDWLPTEEGEANARLIAAAPDIFEALKRIAEHTDPHSPEENYRADDTEGCLDTVFSLARAAIAKAIGEAL